MSMSKGAKGVSWALQLLVVVILGQTLFFKFSGAPESVYIFEALGAEPWGRIGSGVMELLAVVLLLIPMTAAIGALLAIGAMTGAILAHLTKLGIVIQDDGGALFVMAIVIMVSSLVVLFLRRGSLPVVGPVLIRGCPVCRSTTKADHE